MRRIKNYEMFLESINREDIIICDISSNEDKLKATDIVAKQFSEQLEYNESVEYINDVTDWAISKVAKNLLGDIIGVLLLGDTYIHNIMDEYEFIKYKDFDISGKGVEGVALVVSEEYRNKNSLIVYKLIKSIDSVDMDFITIQQYENMPNTMNYGNKFDLIGYYYENDIKVNIYYKRK